MMRMARLIIMVMNIIITNIVFVRKLSIIFIISIVINWPPGTASPLSHKQVLFACATKVPAVAPGLKGITLPSNESQLSGDLWKQLSFSSHLGCNFHCSLILDATLISFIIVSATFLFSFSSGCHLNLVADSFAGRKPFGGSRCPSQGPQGSFEWPRSPLKVPQSGVFLAAPPW